MLRLCSSASAGLLAAALSVWAGCSHLGEERPAPDFFPLHAEDTWVYEVARPMRNVRTRMTVRVRDERYIQALGRRCRLVDETYAADDDGVNVSAGAPAQTEIYPVAYCRDKGFLNRALSLEYQGGEVRDLGLGAGEERFLPEGLGGDVAWDSLTTAYDLGGGTDYRIRQTHHALLDPESVEVPAGRFSGCVRVDTVAVQGGRRAGVDDGDSIVLYYSDWYAANVGLVRTIQSNRPDGGPPLAQIELLAYDVEGAR
jgi:hypothetical protein